MYVLLPINNIISSDLNVIDWTVLQINMVMMIENMKTERIWGGGDNK